MPTYRYECAKCSRIHEEFHAISDPPLAKCPHCGGRLHRLIGGGAGVILKGSGFHKTDYRRKPHVEGGKPEAPKSGSKGQPKRPDAKGGE
jgi:putative FmdB family regulatory protein